MSCLVVLFVVVSALLCGICLLDFINPLWGVDLFDCGSGAVPGKELGLLKFPIEKRKDGGRKRRSIGVLKSPNSFFPWEHSSHFFIFIFRKRVRPEVMGWFRHLFLIEDPWKTWTPISKTKFFLFFFENYKKHKDFFLKLSLHL